MTSSSNHLVHALSSLHTSAFPSAFRMPESHGDILRTVSKFFLRPAKYSGMEPRISIFVKSQMIPKHGQVWKSPKACHLCCNSLWKPTGLTSIQHPLHGARGWSELGSKGFKLTGHMPGQKPDFVLKYLQEVGQIPSPGFKSLYKPACTSPPSLTLNKNSLPPANSLNLLWMSFQYPLNLSPCPYFPLLPTSVRRPSQTLLPHISVLLMEHLAWTTLYCCLSVMKLSGPNRKEETVAKNLCKLKEVISPLKTKILSLQKERVE